MHNLLQNESVRIDKSPPDKHPEAIYLIYRILKVLIS